MSLKQYYLNKTQFNFLSWVWKNVVLHKQYIRAVSKARSTKYYDEKDKDILNKLRELHSKRYIESRK